MKRVNYSAFSVRAMALVAIGIACAGCCDKEKNDLKVLGAQYNDLVLKNKEVNAELATARSRESQLMGQMDSKDMQLMTLKTENDELKARRGGGPVVPTPKGPSRPGDETVLYSETVGSDVLFEPGKATLTAGGRARLDTIAATLRSKYSGMTVRVMGYTDSDPIVKTKNLWKDNLDLSANRAMEVTRHLWSKGISAENVETVAMGATHFVGPNTTKAAKTANRRVEIIVVNKK